MSFFSSFSSKPRELILLADIDSGSVGISLVAYENRAATLLAAERHHLPHPYIHSRERFIADLKRILTKAVVDLRARKLGTPEKIVCVLGSPLAVSHARMAQLSFEKATVLSPAVVRSAIDHAIGEYKEEIAHSFESDDEAPKLVLLEEEPISFSINGYAVEEVSGQKGSSFSAQLFLSVTPDLLYTLLEQFWKTEFPDAEVEFKARPHALFETFVRTSALADAVLVDVGAREVELAVVRSGRITEVGTFPFGRDVVIKALGRELSCTKELVLSTLSVTKANSVSTDERLRCAAAMGKAREELLAQFHSVLAEVSYLYLVPSTVVLFVEEDVREFYASFLEDPSLAQYNLANAPFEMVLPVRVCAEPIFAVPPGMKRDELLFWESTALVHSLLARDS